MSCPAADRCAAIGYYIDNNGEQGLIDTLSSGTWGAQMAPVPPDAAPNPEAGLNDVACPAVDSCVAVGQYAVNGSSYVLGGPSYSGLIDTLLAGKWTATAAPRTAAISDSDDYLRSVDCAVVILCAAIGQENQVASVVGLIETQAGNIPAPTVSGVSPGSGPSAGGTEVTVTGTGFSTSPLATVFDFGATVATETSCTSSTTCTMTAPPGTGTVDVVATVAGNSSSPNPADQFDYRTAPSVSLVPLAALPAAPGPVSYAVDVSGIGAITPTGSVTVTDDHGVSCRCHRSSRERGAALSLKTPRPARTRSLPATREMATMPRGPPR